MRQNQIVMLTGNSPGGTPEGPYLPVGGGPMTGAGIHRIHMDEYASQRDVVLKQLKVST
jgi:hypothetical protein